MSVCDFCLLSFHTDVHNPFSNSVSFLSGMKSVWRGTSRGLVTQMATKWKLAGQDENWFWLTFTWRRCFSSKWPWPWQWQRRWHYWHRHHTVDWHYTLSTFCTFNNHLFITKFYEYLKMVVWMVLIYFAFHSVLVVVLLFLEWAVFKER